MSDIISNTGISTAGINSGLLKTTQSSSTDTSTSDADAYLLQLNQNFNSILSSLLFSTNQQQSNSADIFSILSNSTASGTEQNTSTTDPNTFLFQINQTFNTLLNSLFSSSDEEEENNSSSGLFSFINNFATISSQSTNITDASSYLTQINQNYNSMLYSLVTPVSAQQQSNSSDLYSFLTNLSSSGTNQNSIDLGLLSSLGQNSLF